MTTTKSTADETIGLYDNDTAIADQRRLFRTGRVPVSVYGLGKMGLPLAAVYAETTGAVCGVDIAPDRVDQIAAGECPFENEPGLPDLIAELAATDALTATTDGPAAAEASRLHVIVVPTTVDDGAPDLSNLRAAARDVAAGLTPGDLVVIESTVPPGTCRDVVAPILAGGCDPGEFGLAFCPERTASGHALRDIRGSYPKIVGGIDADSERAAALVYDELTDNELVRVTDATTAESVKLFEGVYRDVNIALANELARFTDELGIDVNEAISAANTQPYCDIHTPGAGVGGHCIPYYPRFLVESLDASAPLVRTAREVNEEMPEFVVRTLASELAVVGTPLAGATVALLGVTYRAGVPETREAPAIAIAERLADLGATVLAVDPLLEELPEMPAEQVSLERLPERTLDAAVLVTAHDAFQSLDWRAFETTAAHADDAVGVDASRTMDAAGRTEDGASGADDDARGIVVIDGRQALDLDGTAHRVYTIGGGVD